MRLVQKPKEETPSLSLWLSRDVPHERELAGDLLNQLGREKSIEYLLRLHDLEETRRQKRLLPYTIAKAVCTMGFIGIMLAIDILFLCHLLSGHGGHPHVPFFFIVFFIVFGNSFRVLDRWAKGGKRSKRAWFSNAVQQNLVTSLFNFADNPLTAEVFIRALSYYRGDRDRLVRCLTDLLPHLPDDPEALTVSARRALLRYVGPPAWVSKGNPSSDPTLQAAIKTYLIHTTKYQITRKAKARLDA